MISLFENATHIVCTGEPGELRTLSNDFRFRPDRYFFSDAYQRFRITDGEDGWDGWIYPFKVTGNIAKVLRGRRDEILNLCKLHGIRVSTEKLLARPFADLGLEDVRPDLIAGEFPLDNFQRRSIQQWLVHGIGIANVTVGGGKTATFAGAAALLKERFPEARIIYVTFATNLVNQAMKDFKKFLPGWDITQFGGGKSNKDGKDIVVCSTAMLTKHFRKLKAERWFKGFMAVLYDEVHHCQSDTSVKVLEEIPAYFRFGASDTMKEDDPASSAKIVGLFGPVRNKTAAAPLIDLGRLAQPHIYLVEVSEWKNKHRDLGSVVSPETPAFVLYEGNWVKGIYKGPVYALNDDGSVQKVKKRVLDDETKEWVTIEQQVIEQGLHRIEIEGEVMEIESRWCLLERAYDRGIIRFKERNSMIVAWTKHFSQRDLQTLVVCTRTLHIYILEALIKKVVHEDLVRILFAAATPKQREECFDWFKKTPGAVLISSIVKEGVSINEIGAGVIADYVADWEKANQIIGRFVRPKKRGANEAEIVWFVDNQHPTFRRGCAGMFQQLEKIGGYRFYYPVTTPESLSQSFEFHGGKHLLPAMGTSDFVRSQSAKDIAYDVIQ